MAGRWRERLRSYPGRSHRKGHFAVVKQKELTQSYALNQLMVGLKNVFYMPVAVAVTPDSVQMPVATEVKPPMCPYKNITVMVAERVQRFVMFHFNRMRWRGFMLWGGFYA